MKRSNAIHDIEATEGPIVRRSPPLRIFILPLIVLMAVLVRAYFLYLTQDLKPVFDEVAYLRMAREVVATGDFGALWRWPPGQPYFIAGIIRVAGENLVIIKAVQVAISSLSVLLIYQVARRAFGSRLTGTLAALLAAIYPSFVAFSHLLWSETLFIFLFLLSIHALFEFTQSRRSHTLFFCGMVFGLACLTRSIALVSVPAIGAYLWLKCKRDRRVVIPWLIFFGAFAAAIAPWTIRNLRVHGAWVVVAPNVGMNLWRGNSQIPGSPAGRNEFSREKYEGSGVTALEREQYALRKAMELIRMNQPHWLLKKCVIHLHNWRVGSSFVLRHLRLGFYGNVAEQTEWLLSILIQSIYAFVMVAAIIGLSWTAYNWESRFLVAIVALFILIYIVTIATNPRMRVSIMPIIVMLSANGLIKVYEFMHQALGAIRSGQTTGAGCPKPSRPRVAQPLRLILCTVGIALFTYVSLSDVITLARRVLRSG